MAYFYSPCAPCCDVVTAATHRLLVNATGAETWHKDHGNTVRAVRCYLETLQPRYFIAGLRSDATARKLNSLGVPLWSVDHGEDCYACDVDVNGKLHTAGRLADSAWTHRRYDASGVLELSINALPFDAGVAVAPDGKIWAFKTEVGGADPETLGDVFRYDFTPSQLGTLDTEAGLVDHDSAGSAYVFHTVASVGDTVSKYTSGTLDWTATRSDTPTSAMAMAVDRDESEVYTCCRVGNNCALKKFLDDGTEDWSFNVGTASNQAVAAMAARVGHVFYSRNVLTSGIIGRINTDGTGNTTVLTPGFGIGTGWLEIDETGDYLFAIVGNVTSGRDLNKYDATGATLSLEWSDATISYQRFAIHDDAEIIVGCGAGSATLVALDFDGNVLWSVDEGNTGDVAITDDYIVTLGGSTTQSRCGIMHVYDHDGNLLWVRNPKRGASLGSLAFSLSAFGDEIVMSYPGDYGAKIFNSDGSLYDYYGHNLQSVVFDSGFTYIAAAAISPHTAIIKKFDTDTWICEWFSITSSVDLAIGSDGRVLTGTSSTLRQLSNVGVSQWTATVGGLIRSVAYDSSNNAFAAFSRLGTTSHSKHAAADGALTWSADHGGGLYGIRIDDNDVPFIGGVRVEA